MFTEPASRAAGRAGPTSLRGFWDGAAGYQRLTYVVGAALILVGLAHAVVGILTGESASGPLSWRKPATFGLSFGLTTITLGWVATYLPRRPGVGWVLAAALSMSTTLEVAWVSIQHARGVPAHFNSATSLDHALFMSGAVAIGVTITVIAAVTLAAFAVTTAPAPVAWALRSGLVALLVAQGVGAWLIDHGLSLVDDGADLLTESMSTHGAAGAMKVAHAVPMHAIQVLGGLAWLLTLTGLTQRRQLHLVASAVAGYAGLLGVVIVRTARGLPPFDPLSVSTVAYLAAVALIAVPLVVAVRHAPVRDALRLRATTR